MNSKEESCSDNARIQIIYDLMKLSSLPKSQLPLPPGISLPLTVNSENVILIFKFVKTNVEFQKVYLNQSIRKKNERFMCYIPKTFSTWLLQCFQNPILVNKNKGEDILGDIIYISLQEIQFKISKKKEISDVLKSQFCRLFHLLNEVKALFFVGISAETAFVTKINDVVWGVLGFVSKFNVNGSQRTSKYVFQEVSNILEVEYPFCLDQLKRTIKARDKETRLFKKNENVDGVEEEDLNKTVQFLLDVLVNYENYENEREKRSNCLSILLQLATGARFNECFGHSAMFLRSLNLVNENSRLNICVFDYLKHEKRSSELNQQILSMKKMIWQLEEIEFGSEEYKHVEEQINCKLYEFIEDKKILVGIIESKPLLFLNSASQFYKLTSILRKFPSKLKQVNDILKIGMVNLSGKQHHLFAPNHVTSHKLRHIYGNYSYQLYGDKKLSINRWLQKVLGHAENNITTSLTYQTFGVNEGEISRIYLKRKIDDLEHRVMKLEEQLQYRIAKEQQDQRTNVKEFTYGSMQMVLSLDLIENLKPILNINGLKRLYLLCKGKHFPLFRDLIRKFTNQHNSVVAEWLIELSFQLVIEKEFSLDTKNQNSIITLKRFLRQHFIFLSPTLCTRVLDKIKSLKKQKCHEIRIQEVQDMDV